jgi:D-glycero-alpha-D-manno-heptose-7-phosphate kinase
MIGGMVDEGMEILRNGQPLTAFGELLHEAWRVKRTLSEQVSNHRVDEIYGEARAAGAIGGKLLGAGGGGFMVLFVPPGDQQRVRERLHALVHVPFKIESSGSQIIYFDPEEDYPGEAVAQAAFPHQTPG